MYRGEGRGEGTDYGILQAPILVMQMRDRRANREN